MNIETERKFLVLNDDYQAQAVKSYRIRQGYLAHDSGRSVRVRIRDDQGFLTIKGPSIILGSRPEWEKEISLQEAEDLFALCKPGSVDKTRWIVPAEMPGQAGHDGEIVMADSDRPSRYFEVDEFHGENEVLQRLSGHASFQDLVIQVFSYLCTRGWCCGRESSRRAQ